MAPQELQSLISPLIADSGIPYITATISHYHVSDHGQVASRVGRKCTAGEKNPAFVVIPAVAGHIVKNKVVIIVTLSVT